MEIKRLCFSKSNYAQTSQNASCFLNLLLKMWYVCFESCRYHKRFKTLNFDHQIKAEFIALKL